MGSLQIFELARNPSVDYMPSLVLDAAKSRISGYVAVHIFEVGGGNSVNFGRDVVALLVERAKNICLLACGNSAVKDVEDSLIYHVVERQQGRTVEDACHYLIGFGVFLKTFGFAALKLAKEGFKIGWQTMSPSPRCPFSSAIRPAFGCSGR